MCFTPTVNKLLRLFKARSAPLSTCILPMVMEPLASHFACALKFVCFGNESTSVSIQRIVKWFSTFNPVIITLIPSDVARLLNVSFDSIPPRPRLLFSVDTKLRMRLSILNKRNDLFSASIKPPADVQMRSVSASKPIAMSGEFVIIRNFNSTLLTRSFSFTTGRMSFSRTL